MTAENTNEWVTHIYGDSREHAIRIRLGTSNYYCDFEILKLYDFESEEYEMVVRGSSKWDGCMNWETDPDCMYHFCSDFDADMLAALFKEVWVLAKELMGDTCDY